MLSGPVSKEKVSFPQQGGYLTNTFLPKGSWGGDMCECTLCVTGFSFCIFIFPSACVSLLVVHDSIPYDFAMKTIRKYWVYFLILSILTNNSSQLSYTELPFTLVSPKITFKLWFIINWLYQGRVMRLGVWLHHSIGGFFLFIGN